MTVDLGISKYMFLLIVYLEVQIFHATKMMFQFASICIASLDTVNKSRVLVGLFIGLVNMNLSSMTLVQYWVQLVAMTMCCDNAQLPYVLLLRIPFQEEQSLRSFLRQRHKIWTVCLWNSCPLRENRVSYHRQGRSAELPAFPHRKNFTHDFT